MIIEFGDLGVFNTSHESFDRRNASARWLRAQFDVVPVLRLLSLVVVFLFFAFSSVVRADDNPVADNPVDKQDDSPDVSVKIGAAIEAYYAALDKAEARLAAEIDKLIDRSADRGDLDRVQELDKQKQVFLEQGVLPKEPIYSVMRRKAVIDIARANRQVDNAYAECVEELTRARHFDDAKRVKAEWDKVKAARGISGGVDLQAIRSVIDSRASNQNKPTSSTESPDLPTLTNLPVLENSIGMQLRLLPAGTFMMGDTTGESAHKPHLVRLSKSFYMGVYEVTNSQWKAVMGEVLGPRKDDDLPVVRVCWEDAALFCQKLSAMPDERSAGRVYRLPTEAEWEYACRAGTTTRFSFGDDASKLRAYGWFDENAGGQTHAVGLKMPNVAGLYDMHGNVWEWCSDEYAAYPAGALTDPRGPAGGVDLFVGRGGSWNDSAVKCKSGFRGRVSGSSRNDNLGFRVALSPPGAKPPKAGK